jgi:hypothetical protein
MARSIQITLIVVVLGFMAPSVLGCSCETPSQRNAFRKARIVFLGKVVQVKVASTHTERTLDYPYAVTFQVERSWKGVHSDTITILARAPFLPCEGFTFHEGDRYLVYAYGDDLLVPVSCTQTKLADSAAGNMRKLNSIWYRRVSRVFLL